MIIDRRGSTCVAVVVLYIQTSDMGARARMAEKDIQQIVLYKYINGGRCRRVVSQVCLQPPPCLSPGSQYLTAGNEGDCQEFVVDVSLSFEFP